VSCLKRGNKNGGGGGYPVDGLISVSYMEVTQDPVNAHYSLAVQRNNLIRFRNEVP
jgi:hypothetical protein